MGCGGTWAYDKQAKTINMNYEIMGESFNKTLMIKFLNNEYMTLFYNSGDQINESFKYLLSYLTPFHTDLQEKRLIICDLNLNEESVLSAIYFDKMLENQDIFIDTMELIGTAE